MVIYTRALRNPGTALFNISESILMNKTTNLFLSVRCDKSYLQEMTEEGDANGYTTPVLSECGFTLIANRLVPETYIRGVQSQLENRVFDYGCVLSTEYLFEAEFLAALDDDQLEVLMPTVLLLFARGTLPLNLWSAECQTA
jgi:hypothetical protein